MPTTERTRHATYEMTAAQLVYGLVGQAIDREDPYNALSDLAGTLYTQASRKHDAAWNARQYRGKACSTLRDEFRQNAAELRDLAGYVLRVAGTYEAEAV